MRIGDIGKKYSKTPAQVILCFLINLGVSVIPKTNNLQCMKDNYEYLFDFDPAD